VARVILHEIDHLDGILFIDKLSPAQRRLIKGKLSRIKAGEKVG
jgi:peptide deformylase